MFDFQKMLERMQDGKPLKHYAHEFYLDGYVLSRNGVPGEFSVLYPDGSVQILQTRDLTAFLDECRD